MENKYYTPAIEEFHVGFEYEQSSIKMVAPKKWSKEIFYLNNGHIDIVKYGDLDKNTRVKYLDKEDIESLGFIGQEANTVYFKKDKYRLVHWLASNEIGRDISIYESYDGGTQEEALVRKVIIKNKSELKKLLKQLGI
jgi:hypothetical protein